MEGGGSREPQLLPLPPTCATLRACCWSPDGSGGDRHTGELEGAVPGLGPLPGALQRAASGYGLSRYLVSKAVGVS